MILSAIVCHRHPEVQARVQAEAPAAKNAEKNREQSMTDISADSVPAVVRAAVDAANAHDIDAFLACFGADGAVDDWGRVFTGPDAIRGWSDAEFIGTNVTLTELRFRVRGASTAVDAQVGGDGFNGPSTFAFTVDGDSVSLMKITG